MKRSDPAWDEARKYLLDELSTMEPGTEEFTAVVKNLKDLEEARSLNADPKLDPNKVLTAGVYLGSIGLLVVLDQHFPLMSRITSFVMKLKI